MAENNEIDQDQIDKINDILRELGTTFEDEIKRRHVGSKSWGDAEKEVVKYTEMYKKSREQYKKTAQELNRDMQSIRKSLNAGEMSAEELSDRLETLRKEVDKTIEQDKKKALLDQKMDLERLNAQNKASAVLKDGAFQTAGAMGAGIAKAIGGLARSALTSSDSFEVAGSLMSAGVDIINTANQGGANALKSFGAATAGAGGKVGILGAGAEIAGTALGALSDGMTELAKAGIGFMIGQTKQLIGGFNAMSSAGAIYTGGMTEMISTAQTAGMTLDQFSKAVSSNTTALAKSGLGVGDASKRMAGAMEKGGKSAQAGMFALGMSMEDQAAAYAQTMATMAGPTGQLKASNAEVAAQTQEYAKTLKMVSDITGEDAKAKQEKLRQDNDTLAFNAVLDKMSEKERAATNNAMMLMSADQQRAFREQHLYGTIISKDLAGTAATNTAIAKNFNDTFQASKNHTLDAKKMAEIQHDTAADMKKQSDEAGASIGLATSGPATEIAKSMNEINQYGQKFSNAQKVAAEIAEAQKKGQTGQAGDEVKLQQQQQQFMLEQQALAAKNLGLFSKALEESQKAAILAVKALGSLAETAKENPIKAGILAALPAILGFVGPMLLSKFAGGKFGVLGTPGNPMHVTMGGGGGGPDLSDLGGGEKGGKGKGLTQDKSGKWRNEKGQFASKAEIAEHLAEKEAKQAGGVMSKFKQFGKIGGKALGIAGAVASLGMMAKDLYDTSKDTKLTTGQKHEKEGGIVGEGLGGAGGAWAGAALGAANPVALALDPFTFGMSSVVGGALGGALGYWGGSKLGGMAGKAVMKDKPVAPAAPTTPAAHPSPSVQNTAPKPPTSDHAVTTASAALATTQAEEKARKDAMVTPAANLPPGVQQQIELLQQILTTMLKNNQITNGILQHSM